MLRRLLIALGIFLALLTLAAALVWREAPGLVEREILASAQRLGVEPLALGSVVLASDHLLVSDVSAGKDRALTAEVVRVDFSLSGLLERRVDGVTVEGLRVAASFGSEGLELGGLEDALLREKPPPDGPQGPAPAPAAATKLPPIELRGAKIALDSPLGRIDLELGARLAEGALRGSARASGKGLVGELSVEPQTGPEARDRHTAVLTLTLDHLRLPDLERALSGEVRLAGDLAGNASAARAELELRVDGSSDPPLADGVDRVELRLPLEIELEGGRLEVSARDGDAAVPGLGLVLGALGFTLEVDPGPRALDGHYSVSKVAITTASLATRGPISATGPVALRDGRLTSQMDLALDGLSLATKTWAVLGIRGEVHFDSAWPLATAAVQKLEIAKLDTGLVLEKGRAGFTLSPDGWLDLRSIGWDFAGGRLTGSGRVRAFGEERGEDSVVLRASGLDLGILLRELDLDGLDGEGLLEGRIPLVVAAGELAVRGGELTSSQPGVVRYRPSTAPAALGSGGDPEGGVNLLLRVLQDFHYESLRVTVEGRITGTLELGLYLKGANPAVYDGYPIQPNLNFSVPLSSLLRGASAGNLDLEAIERRLRRRSRRRRRRLHAPGPDLDRRVRGGGIGGRLHAEGRGASTQGAHRDQRQREDRA